MKTVRDRIPGQAISKHALHLCFLLIAGLLLCGCKPEAKVAGGGDPTGVYALVSVNGNPVPAGVAHEGATLQVRSGAFAINADGTCSTKTVFVPPSGSEVTREVSATYTQTGSQLTMRWKGAGTTTGTIEGNTFTMTNEGMVFVYRVTRLPSVPSGKEASTSAAQGRNLRVHERLAPSSMAAMVVSAFPSSRLLT